MNRTDRREGKRQVFKEMKSLGWTEFREVDTSSHPNPPRGVRRFWQNNQYSVQEYLHLTEWGLVTNLMIRRHDGAPAHNWQHFQRIKNELYGENAVAIEVYPAERDKVDDANLYHLWVLPPTFTLPFGLHTSDQTKVVAR